MISLLFTLVMIAAPIAFAVVAFKERERRLLAERDALRWRFRWDQTRAVLHQTREELNAAKAQLRRYMGSP